MSSSMYEIVELANGDVVLQKADEQEGEPLVSIRFSKEALGFMKNAKFDITKAMMEAGMAVAGELTAANPDESFDDGELAGDGQILH